MQIRAFMSAGEETRDLNRDLFKYLAVKLGPRAGISFRWLRCLVRNYCHVSILFGWKSWVRKVIAFLSNRWTYMSMLKVTNFILNHKFIL